MQYGRILGGRKLLVYVRNVVAAIFDYCPLSFRVSNGALASKTFARLKSGVNILQKCSKTAAS